MFFISSTNFRKLAGIIEQDSGLFMASLDVESLFTNVPLEETINNSCGSLFGNEDKIKNFSRNDL